jgi:CelD/BcsL family acetyltransferase involved in cellulose biosynthesis
MTSHAWLCAWWEAFAADASCRVITVWDGSRLVAAAPFIHSHRAIALFANTWVDRINVLVETGRPEGLAAILEELERMRDAFDVLDLRPLDQTSPQTDMLIGIARARGWRVGVETDLQSPRLSLPGTWAELLESLSSSFRQTVRRKLRKIEGMPEVTVRIVTGSECLEAIEAVSPDTWQADNGTAMTSQPNVWKFYRQIIATEAAEGNLCCVVMEVDGNPAAFEFNLLHRGTCHNFKIGFRKMHADLSSGIVMKAQLFKALLDAQSASRPTEYDFMGAAEPYKLNWAKDIRSHGRYRFYPPGLFPPLQYLAHFVLKPFIRAHCAPLFRLVKYGMLRLGMSR